MFDLLYNYRFRLFTEWTDCWLSGFLFLLFFSIICVLNLRGWFCFLLGLLIYLRLLILLIFLFYYRKGNNHTRYFINIRYSFLILLFIHIVGVYLLFLHGLTRDVLNQMKLRLNIFAFPF